MGKLYNIQLNSINASTITSTYSDVTYNIDWVDLLPPDKRFKVKFSFIGGLNFGNNHTFPVITTNLLGNTYKPATNGYQNSYYLGHLLPNVVINPILNPIITYFNYTVSTDDNPPIYLDNRPINNNLQVRILNGTETTDFKETYLTLAGGGTMIQSGFLITITSVTSGLITIGTVITPSLLAGRTITAFVTGTGGVGSYICNLSQTVSSRTYSFPADTTQTYTAPYVMNLHFEELDE